MHRQQQGVRDFRAVLLQDLLQPCFILPGSAQILSGKEAVLHDGHGEELGLGVNARILGVVLNGYDVKKTGKKDGYYYSYAYGYSNDDAAGKKSRSKA